MSNSNTNADENENDNENSNTSRNHGRRDTIHNSSTPVRREELLREEVQMIRMRTLYQMVNELTLSSTGSSRRQNAVWLTNKQANTFQEPAMHQLLTALGISNPPPLVIFLRGGKFSKAMIKNAGTDYLTRVKFEMPCKDITLIDNPDTEITNSNANTLIKPGTRVKVKISGIDSEGQVLWVDSAGKVANVLSDKALVSLQMTKRLVAATPKEREKLERRISIFVTEVLMPIVVKTGALVVCAGINDCSLCVALGKAFATLSSRTKGGLIGHTSKKDAGAAAKKKNPRLIAITKFPSIAAAVDRPGSNAHALKTANSQLDLSRKMSGHAATQSSFITEQYKEFLSNISGVGEKNKSAWKQYDLVDGLTDVILLDGKHGEKADETAYNHFVNTFANLFAGDVPSLSMQFGTPSGHGGVASLVDLVSRGAKVIFLDSRRRKCKRGCTLKEALDDLERMHYDMWKKGAAEMHLASTIAFLHRILCERPNAPGDMNRDENKGHCNYIGDQIRQMEEKNNNLLKQKKAPNVEDEDAEAETEAAAAATNFAAKTNETDDNKESNIDISDGKDEKKKDMKFEGFVDRVIEIIRANEYVLKVLNKLYMEIIKSDDNVDVTDVGIDITDKQELLSCLNLSIPQLAAKCSRSRTGLWLRIHTLLKPAWERGSFPASDFFSGNLCNVEILADRLERRLALVDRLPENNTLEELHALRDAWCDVDRYEKIGTQAKCAAKWSYLLLLLLGVATAVVATLVGSNYFPTNPTKETLTNATGSTVAPAMLTASSSFGDAVAFVLAVVSSFCASYIAYMNPVQRWQELKSASLQLRSEIFRFRTRVGVYDYKVKTKDVLLLRETVAALREHTLARAAIGASTFFQQYPKETYRHGQYVCFDPPITSDVAYKRPHDTFKTGPNQGECKPDCTKCIDENRNKQNKQSQQQKLQKETRGSGGGGGTNNVVVVPVSSTIPEVPFSSTSPEWHTKPMMDDYHSPMDANAYIALRLEPMLRFYQSRIHPYYRSKTFVAVFLMVATGASAIMAALGLTVWIGIVAIVASSVTSWSEFSGVGKKLGRYSQAITKLRDLRLWWETLSTVEQASSKHVTQLVELTEDICSHDTKAWLASAATKSLTKAAAEAKK